MMMMPSIFGGNLFNDDWMDFSFPDIDKELYGKHAKNLMKTDVKEKDGNYEVAIDLPGFKKDEITAELKDGYLTISAAKGLDKDEKDKEGKYSYQPPIENIQETNFQPTSSSRFKEVAKSFLSNGFRAAGTVCLAIGLAGTLTSKLVATFISPTPASYINLCSFPLLLIAFSCFMQPLLEKNNPRN